MSFLRRLLSYKRICIQCHDNPDADTLASAYGVYCYLKSHGSEADIVYGGTAEINKSCMKMMVQECEIPVKHVEGISDYDLLLMVDCQYGQGNVQKFSARETAIIDHHILMVEERENYLVKSDYQSCSTIVWEMLCEENYPVKENEKLTVALLYGLYTDTSCFADLYSRRDTAMRTELFDDQPLFEQLTKSSMSVAELMVVSDAMFHHYFDVDRHLAIVEALTCEQTVLSIIGDMMIQVDVIDLSFTYTENANGYQISIRTCRKELPANEIARFVCEGIGNGGGHARKAGGRIRKEKMQEQYAGMSIFDVVNLRLCQFVDKVCAGGAVL